LALGAIRKGAVCRSPYRFRQVFFLYQDFRTHDSFARARPLR
jgi:hypothetical protein